MPRISLYKPEKGKDFDFIDKTVYEMFTVGGTDVFLHKYIGTDDGTTAKDHTQIQDMLFLENRDRKYDPDVYNIRGIYNVQDIDFDLSQFGLFLSNDTLFMTIHISSSVKTIGRKIMLGDVIELPHLRDEYAANDIGIALKRYYVVEDVTRASEGYSPTWYPHLYRVKLKQIVDSQEYKDILDLPMNEDAPDQGTLRDLLSTYEKEMQINNAILSEAEADAPLSGYETGHYYTLDDSTINPVADPDPNASTVVKEGYQGYLTGNGLPPNGENFGHGISFPTNATTGDYFLRTDFMPTRLFRYDGSRWVKQEDNVRMTLTNTDTRSTLKTSFINNTKANEIGGETVPERQSVANALRPKADN
jgi:hypothetical protein